MVFNAKNAELHMGILQNRLGDIKGQMQVCLHKLDMKDAQIGKSAENPIANGIDYEEEKLKFAGLDAKYGKLKIQLEMYENEVLNHTKL